MKATHRNAALATVRSWKYVKLLSSHTKTVEDSIIANIISLML
ncbi:hypothetical protein HMPREF1152_1723 [Mogibacterium sp. CM50]|nr:hypothetical protein HMPREF1152_1723 [Mogibacterium sp. CM50]